MRDCVFLVGLASTVAAALVYFVGMRAGACGAVGVVGVGLMVDAIRASKNGRNM
jgi:hypothetical protein